VVAVASTGQAVSWSSVAGRGLEALTDGVHIITLTGSLGLSPPCSVIASEAEPMFCSGKDFPPGNVYWPENAVLMVSG
jgi:hypothetical protein